MTNFNRLNDLNTEKLAHYNKWLLDTKRPLDQRYPGFPKQAEIDALAGLTIAVPVVARVKKSAAPKSTKTVVKAARGGTKLEQARQLYAAASGKSRDEIVAVFMDKLNMTKAGATTYFYNVRKV